MASTEMTYSSLKATNEARASVRRPSLRFRVFFVRVNCLKPPTQWRSRAKRLSVCARRALAQEEQRFEHRKRALLVLIADHLRRGG